MTTLPRDDNAEQIQVLAPRTLTTYTLTASEAQALAANNDATRIVRLLTTASDCLVGVADSASVAMPLSANTPEYIKIDAGLTLYASGSGTLHITVMG